MDLELAGKVIVVTGGASNIGRAIAQEAAREGAVVAILDRDVAQTAKTVAGIAAAGGKAIGQALDVTDVAATRAAIESIERDRGPIEALVNNVGWNGKAEFFLNLTPERWQQAFQLNLFSTLNVTHAALPRMVERRRGAVVNIASDAGFGEFRMADYGAMKAGVLAFTRTIAKEYGRYGIRANAVAPGLVLPEPDSIGEGSLWRSDIGMGPKEV
ncbi:MAG TPA: SDR family NAD(P)-dependent oxidoreductase, partial [Vineibacter sp.]|nr:SDR family NAD(P)-dependent oxidoreductase [Vineibacter sp.]